MSSLFTPQSCQSVLLQSLRQHPHPHRGPSSSRKQKSQIGSDDGVFRNANLITTIARFNDLFTMVAPLSINRCKNQFVHTATLLMSHEQLDQLGSGTSLKPPSIIKASEEIMPFGPHAAVER